MPLGSAQWERFVTHPFAPKIVAETWNPSESSVQSGGTSAHLFICRSGYERILAEEWSRFRPPASGSPEISAPPAGSGCVQVAATESLPPAPFIFERQRLPHARFGAGDDLTALAAALAAEAAPGVADRTAWTLHAFAPDPDSEDSRTREAQALERRILERMRGAYPAAWPHYRSPDAPLDATDARVWQVCRVAGGAWSSVAAPSALSDPRPGGIHRMPPDPLAPSRSYLKIEEALDVMRLDLRLPAPRPGETAVDLGAAPGGWTWAFVKRGCRVFAVDNGPLKLRSAGDMGGEAIHLREDGLRFRPQDHVRTPVDWLLSDMLIAPGVALGLLRRWIAGGWARRMIVNLKLPQTDPLVALRPVQDYLRSVPGLRWRLRQLYHDRREVTLMGELTATKSAVPERRPKGSRPPGRQPAKRSRLRRSRR